MHEHRNECKYWEEVWQKDRVLWKHNGDPKMPHMVHPSTGLHSDAIFRSRIAMENPIAFSSVTLEMAKKLRDYFWEEQIFQRPICVVGVSVRAAILAYGVAQHLGTYGKFRFACAEQYSGVFPQMSAKGEQILFCVNELITGEDIEKFSIVAEDAGNTVLPVIATLFNHSGLTEIGRKKIFSLVDHPMSMWEENECPLCEQGSLVLSPGVGDFWEQLFVS